MEVLQKSINRITIWSSNSTLGQISRQSYNSKRYMNIYVHSSLIHNSQEMETTYMSTDRWIAKEDVVHIYNGKLLSHKNNWNNYICSNMDRSKDHHTKWNKSERERQMPYDITYLESKIQHNWTYLWNRNREIENRHRQHRLSRGRVLGKGWSGRLGLADRSFYV